MTPFLFFFVFVERVLIQFLEIQEFSRGHVEGQGNFVQRFYPGILGEPANDIVQSRLLYIAHGGEFVYGNAALFTELGVRAMLSCPISDSKESGRYFRADTIYSDIVHKFR